MIIQMQDGLPIISISLAYKGKKIQLDNVLLDTGCSTTIFDTDEPKIPVNPYVSFIIPNCT